MTLSTLSLTPTYNTLYNRIGQSFGAYLFARRDDIIQISLFTLGIMLLDIGIHPEAYAMSTTYNETRVANSVNAILTYIEGSFGALVMVSAGIGAILSSAFGQYRAALGLLVVAVGSFILRSVLATFLNDQGIRS